MLHPMRHLMSVIEARRPTAPGLSHEQLVAQEQEKQAAVLVGAKAQIATLKTQALTVAKEAQNADFDLGRKWDQTWVIEARTIIHTMRKQALVGAQEEHEYNLEDNPNAVMPSVNLLEIVNEGIAQWWDQKKDRLEWGDARYRLGQYMDAHRKTEMSDDMSRLQGEDEMLRHIQYLDGGFGSFSEMQKTLGLLSNYFSTANRILDNGWSQIGETTSDLVNKGIPVVILYCQLITAIP